MRPSRLTGVDAARGLVLLAMMAVHVLPSRGPDGSTSVAHLVAGGRASAAFAVLAGVGLSLAYARGAREGRRSRFWTGVAITVRALVIGAVGLVLGALGAGVAVILPYYAVLFVLAIPLLHRSTRMLVAVGLLAATLVPLASALVRQGRPDHNVVNPTPLSVLADPGARLLELTLTGYYPALAWCAYLCAGLLVGRLDLRSPRVAAALLGVGTVLALGASLLSWLLLEPLGGRARIAAAEGLSPAALELELTQSQHGGVPTTTWWWLASDGPHATTPLDLAHTTGTALAILGAVLLLARVGARVLAPLAAAGAMTLTLYTAHVLVLASGLQPAHRGLSYVLQVLAALAFAVAWTRKRGRGPLEAAVARLVDPARRRARRGAQAPPSPGREEAQGTVVPLRPPAAPGTPPAPLAPGTEPPAPQLLRRAEGR